MTGKSPASHVRTLIALAEPNRLRIVELLRGGPLTWGRSHAGWGSGNPQASKHLKVLSEYGILDVKAEGNRRIYALRPDPFQALDVWLSSMRQSMEDRFDKLDAYLRELQDKKNPGGPT